MRETKDLHIDLSIDVCVDETDYDKCYDYLQEMREYLTSELEDKFDCTSESYLD